MTIEYQIKFVPGGVTITQSVGSQAPKATQGVQNQVENSDLKKRLGNTLASSTPSPSARQDGGAPGTGEQEIGHGPQDQGGGIIVFGPIILCANGQAEAPKQQAQNEQANPAQSGAHGKTAQATTA